MTARFLSRSEVAEELSISTAQVSALIRRGELRSLKVGGRGTWRIARDDLEMYVKRAYEETERWISEHPFPDGDDEKDS